MTVTDCLARGFKFEVNDGTASVPDWKEVGGINTWGHSPTGNNADTTKFANAGRMSHMKASRGDEFTISGMYQEDPDDGTRDAGQSAVESWANEVGPASVQGFRITSPAGTTLTFDATATVTFGGGGNDDPNAWSATITVTGSITRSTIPAVPGAVTSVTGTTDDEQSVVDWTAGTGSPFLFEVVAYAGSDEVKRVQSTGKPILVAGLTNGTEYTFKVRAKNAGGWGDLSAASSGVTPAS